MTGDSPIPRLSPAEVLQVLDQMMLEAEEARQMTVWRHNWGCQFTFGIWEPDATCGGCLYEVKYRNEIDQYLLVPVPADKPPDGAT